MSTGFFVLMSLPVTLLYRWGISTRLVSGGGGCGHTAGHAVQRFLPRTHRAGQLVKDGHAADSVGFVGDTRGVVLVVWECAGLGDAPSGWRAG